MHPAKTRIVPPTRRGIPKRRASPSTRRGLSAFINTAGIKNTEPHRVGMIISEPESLKILTAHLTPRGR